MRSPPSCASSGSSSARTTAAGPARAGAGNLIARIPAARGRRGVDLVLRPRRHRPSRRADRGGRRRRRPAQRRGHDPRRRQQGGGDRADGAGSGRWPRSPARSGSSWSSRSPRSRGCAARRRWTPRRCESECGFVLDHATPIGEVITASPTYKKIIAEFRGIEAHAGIRPEAGRSAIEAASAAIATMDLGRIDEETTANVGTIGGGTRAERRRRPLPGRGRGAQRRGRPGGGDGPAHGRRLHLGGGRARARRRRDGRDLLPRLPDQALLAARWRWRGPASSACGIEPLEVTTGGGSDANALRAGGFDALLLANGTEANHTSDESVPVAELDDDARRLPGDRRARRRLAEAAPRDGGRGATRSRSRSAGERRRAWADESLVGPCEVGDEVVVNTAAIDLGLGSGGFDVVHVNLTRGLEGGDTPPGVHVMKLNYTSLQHAVEPVEAPADSPPGRRGGSRSLVLPLHGHLAPVAWAAAQAGRGSAASASSRPAGGGLPGLLSGDVDGAARPRAARRARDGGAVLRRRARGDQRRRRAPRGGGGARLGRGDRRAGARASSARRPATATAAWRRSTPPTRRSRSGCRRSSRRACPPATRGRATSGSATTRARCSSCCCGRLRCPSRRAWPSSGRRERAGHCRRARSVRTRCCRQPVDLDGYAGSGLPTRTMGRHLHEDPLFFAAPLAAGVALDKSLPV